MVSNSQDGELISRAANGVVIITTKSGRKDQPLKVDYTGYFGVDKISKGEI